MTDNTLRTREMVVVSLMGTILLYLLSHVLYKKVVYVFIASFRCYSVS